MYNVSVPLAQRAGLSAWASIDAVMGVVGVAFYGLFLSTGLIKPNVYRLLMGVSVVLLGYGGVAAKGTHLFSFWPEAAIRASQFLV